MDNRNHVLADVFVKDDNLVKQVVICFLFSIFIAMASQVAMPVPFSPVPITGQTFAIILTGLLLGRNRAILTVLLYLAEGAMGLPVFAPVGMSYGIARLLGPTGGYLLGFVAMAAYLGHMAEKGWTRSFIQMFYILVVSEMILYSFGLFRLSAFVPSAKLLYVGLIPFLPGDLFKILLVSSVLPTAWKFIKKID